MNSLKQNILGISAKNIKIIVKKVLMILEYIFWNILESVPRKKMCITLGNIEMHWQNCILNYKYFICENLRKEM